GHGSRGAGRNCVRVYHSWFGLILSYGKSSKRVVRRSLERTAWPLGRPSRICWKRRRKAVGNETQTIDRCRACERVQRSDAPSKSTIHAEALSNRLAAH